MENSRSKGKIIAVILALVTVLGFSTVAPVVNGMAAFMTAGKFIEALMSSGSGGSEGSGTGEEESGPGQVYSEDAIIEAMEDVQIPEAEVEKAMRISFDNFKYMLQKVSDYNHAGEQTRTITVKGIREYTETVEVPEHEDPETGEVIKAATEEFYCEEEVEKEIEVSNRMYEGAVRLDFRLFYYFCVLAACDRDTSDAVLESVVPLDRDLQPITEEYADEYPGDTTGYYITKKDIDRIFTYVTVKYDYRFDVLRDGRDIYTMEECGELPHEEDITGDRYTAAGRYTFYLPRSFAEDSEGGYSELVNLWDGNDVVTGAKESFDYDRLLATAVSLNKNFREEEMEETISLISGGAECIARLKTWKASDYAVTTGGMRIIVSGGTSTGSGQYVINGMGLTLQQSENLDFVWRYLTGTLKYSNAVAAGICGNVMQESGFDPEAGRDGGAMGLFQWTGGRKTALLKKSSPWSLVTQLEYFRRELDQSYSAAFNTYSDRYFGKAFLSLDEPQDACEVFCVVFEGCIYDPANGCGVNASAVKSTCASDGKRYQDLETRKQYALSIFRLKTAYAGGEAYNGTDLPYYCQWAEEWAGVSLGKGTISSRGCSLCSACMAATYCLGEVVTPYDAANIKEVYLWTSTHDSMSHEAYQLALSHYGLEYRVLDQAGDTSTMKTQIISALTKHHPVILSVKKGSYSFTSNTHYIVLRYIDSQGGIHLHDPAHPAYSEKTFNLDEILTQLNNRSGCVEVIPGK